MHYELLLYTNAIISQNLFFSFSKIKFGPTSDNEKSHFAILHPVISGGGGCFGVQFALECTHMVPVGINRSHTDVQGQ